MKNKVAPRARRITFRLSDGDLAKLQESMGIAGYKSESAYIRDAIIHGQVKQKSEVNFRVLDVQRELMNLASMINAGRDKSEMMAQVMRVSAASLGDAK
ncbi:hypothetical protein D9M71_657810 [compost metagenome]